MSLLAKSASSQWGEDRCCDATKLSTMASSNKPETVSIGPVPSVPPASAGQAASRSPRAHPGPPAEAGTPEARHEIATATGGLMSALAFGVMVEAVKDSMKETADAVKELHQAT